MRCSECFLVVPAKEERSCPVCGAPVRPDALDVLGEGGITPEVREPQLEMAEVVQTALDSRENAITEAGVGTGKSLAYAVPAVLSGKRVVISTATIGLQAQLMEKDLPYLQKALKERYGLDFTYALAKGRGNYICGVAVEAYLQHQKKKGRESVLSDTVIEFAHEAVTGKHSGDKTLLGEHVPSNWADVSAEECVGKRCAFALECGYRKARTKIATSNLVVANHALVGVDLMLSNEKKDPVTGQPQETVGPILGPYSAIVFDEAHKLTDYIRSAITYELNTGVIDSIAKSMDRVGLTLNGAVAHEIEAALKSLFLLLPSPGGTEAFARIRIAHVNSLRFLKIANAIDASTEQLLGLLRNSIEARTPKKGSESVLTSETAKQLGVLEKAVQRVGELRAAVRSIAPAEAGKEYMPNQVAYTVLNRERKELIVAPVEIAAFMKDRLYSKGRAVVMSSATLSVNGNFAALKRETGLVVRPEYELRVNSPFNYADVSALYVPSDLPEPPNSRDLAALAPYAKALATRIVALTEITKGRAFVLFTSKMDMEAVRKELVPYHLNLLVQDGSMTPGALLERYREHAVNGTAPILLGLKTFWEGVSVEGDSLSSVIITKLPFPSMSDPVYQAQCEAVGDEAFIKVTVPAMIKDVQQGTGRLIRTMSDIGIVAILDPRIHTKNYGKLVLNSIPFTARSASIDKIKAHYQKLLEKHRS